MANRVFITGIGIISAIGNNIKETRISLQQGISGIKKATILKSKYTNEFLFGEVPFETSILKDWGGISNQQGISRTEALAKIAVQQAIEDAELSKEELHSYNMAFISASTVGGMTMTDQLHNDANKIDKPSKYLSSYNVGEHAINLIKHYGIKGKSSTFNTACSSSANAIIYGTKLIKSGRSQRAIVGGSDALAKFAINGFNSLRILSSNPTMPFDENRSGLTLGEGAAYLILESEEVVGYKNIYAEVRGYGNANDAFHPSSLSEEAIGPIKSISEALNVAKLSPKDICYINAHGTGTENNDQTELTGLTKVFKNDIPPFQSTKTYTGHTLAASGAIETIFSILSLNNKELYPSLNFKTPIKNFNTYPILNYTKNHPMNYVLSNSFGFGGNCSTLIFSKI